MAPREFKVMPPLPAPEVPPAPPVSLSPRGALSVPDRGSQAGSQPPSEPVIALYSQKKNDQPLCAQEQWQRAWKAWAAWRAGQAAGTQGRVLLRAGASSYRGVPPTPSPWPCPTNPRLRPRSPRRLTVLLRWGQVRGGASQEALVAHVPVQQPWDLAVEAGPEVQALRPHVHLQEEPGSWEAERLRRTAAAANPGAD